MLRRETGVHNRGGLGEESGPASRGGTQDRGGCM